MGFRYPAKVEFDRMDLSNEDAEKALLIQLSDRNIVSDELIQRVFGFDPDTEKSRLNRETRERASDRMIQKAGPWHDPQFENSLKKISLQIGLTTPSQVGLELEKKKSGEKTSMEMKAATTPAAPPIIGNGPPKGQPGQGRPKNKKDTQKRKTKKFSPQTGATMHLWAIEAQDKIAEIINPHLLEFYDKKNMRSLSHTEYQEAEVTKTKILFTLDPLVVVNDSLVLSKLNTIDSIDVKHKNQKYKTLIKNISTELNRPLTADEIKYAKAYFYKMVYSTL